jgi:hypothetical protein
LIFSAAVCGKGILMFPLPANANIKKYLANILLSVQKRAIIHFPAKAIE